MPMPDEKFNEKDREDKVAELKQRIEQGDYVVDPTAVADAIVRRLRELAQARLRAQNECSYPASSSVASTNEIAAAPSTTSPTRVRPAPFRRALAGVVSSVFHASAGTQTHSS
jgi:Anti-sigma-28 factor, FlgM